MVQQQVSRPGIEMIARSIKALFTSIGTGKSWRRKYFLVALAGYFSRQFYKS